MLHITRTTYHRKGVSTILGTLIFIGILFSAVIPMMLTMKQADIIMEQEKLELQRIDDENPEKLLTSMHTPKGKTNYQCWRRVDAKYPPPSHISG